MGLYSRAMSTIAFAQLFAYFYLPIFMVGILALLAACRFSLKGEYSVVGIGSRLVSAIFLAGGVIGAVSLDDYSVDIHFYNKSFIIFAWDICVGIYTYKWWRGTLSFTNRRYTRFDIGLSVVVGVLVSIFASMGVIQDLVFPPRTIVGKIMQIPYVPTKRGEGAHYELCVNDNCYQITQDLLSLAHQGEYARVLISVGSREVQAIQPLIHGPKVP